MAIRKTYEEKIVVAGDRSNWLIRCEQALATGGFKKIRKNEQLFQLQADYKKLTTWGEITITLVPQGNQTVIAARVTANVDNIFALFKSPGKTILDAFKNGLTTR